MIYNINHKFGQIFSDPGQEEIKKTPPFYCASTEFILNHPETPQFLKDVLIKTPWVGDRKYTVTQVRIDDVRTGNFWHIDTELPPIDGKRRATKSYDDFHLYLTSFGDVSQTEFIEQPLDLVELNPYATNYRLLLDQIKKIKDLKTHKPLNGQQVNYTTYDIHRTSPRKNSNVRCVIISVETDMIAPANLFFPVHGWKLTGKV